VLLFTRSVERKENESRGGCKSQTCHHLFIPTQDEPVRVRALGGLESVIGEGRGPAGVWIMVSRSLAPKGSYSGLFRRRLKSGG
jgi:hypothetical protein